MTTLTYEVPGLGVAFWSWST